MIYYKSIGAMCREEDILLRASRDIEVWTEEEKQSLQTIAKGLQTLNTLNDKIEVLFTEWPDDIEEKLAEIRLQEENLSKRVSWWKLQGNQGIAFRDNRRPFAFRVVGYSDHDGYFTPGIGIFEC